MGLFSTLNYIVNHPLNRESRAASIFRFLKWQINIRLNPYPIIYQFTEKSKLIISKGMTGATGNLYCGLHEFNDMSFLLHFLRPEDLFVDIGANVGSYTVLSAAHIRAQTISIEPVPKTFKFLVDNIRINNIQEYVKEHNVALGAKKGRINFTFNLDTVNHVATEIDKHLIEVKVETLDEILTESKKPTLLKIDVEGFETEVINGANNTLLCEELKAIIIELNGSGLRYGFDEKEIALKLNQLGFQPYSYNPWMKNFEKMDSFGIHNSIFIRDLDFVIERVKTAPEIKIFNNYF